jgi:ABC-2 type transport system permease protein
MFAIFKKELRSYFINAIGYVFVGAFLAAAALLCCYTTLGSQSYSTSSYFTMLIFSFIILIPLLTMKLFAEEKKLRTEQLLMTAPVSVWGMVMGKFLAAFALFCGTVAVSCINFFPLYSYARAERAGMEYSELHVGPVTSQIFASVIGIILIGAAFIAIGLFVSSLTENQLAAAVITVSIIFVMLILDVVNQYIDVYAIRFVINWVCLMSRFANFSNGILDYSSILYYLSISGVFLLLTVRVYDKRRWG